MIHVIVEVERNSRNVTVYNKLNLYTKTGKLRLVCFLWKMIELEDEDNHDLMHHPRWG